MSEKKIAAFFDMDSTLYYQESWWFIFKYLYRIGYKRFYWTCFFIWAIINLLIVKIKLRNKLNFYRVFQKRFIYGSQGLNVKIAEKYFKSLYEEYIKYKLYPIMLDKIKWHKEQGHLIFIVTGAPMVLARYVGEQIEANYLITRHMEIENNHYTGRTFGKNPFEKVKVELVYECLEKNNLEIDLENSYTYADNYFDIPFLELCGHPSVVSPKSKLKKYAKEHNWEIIIPR